MKKRKDGYMKRLFAVFAALLLFLSVVSCGKPDNNESFSQSDVLSTNPSESEAQDVIASSSDAPEASDTASFTKTKTDSKQNSTVNPSKNNPPVSSDSTEKQSNEAPTVTNKNNNNTTTTEKSESTTGQVQLATGDGIDYGWY